MQINRLKKQSVTVPTINKEGYQVVQDNLTRRFLLSSLALNTRRSRSFYHTDGEAFQEFLGHVREALEKDRLFALGLPQRSTQSSTGLLRNLRGFANSFIVCERG